MHSNHFNLHSYDKEHIQVEIQRRILYVYYFYLHESKLKQNALYMHWYTWITFRSIGICTLKRV